jgi:hypothetical protein
MAESVIARSGFSVQNLPFLTGQLSTNQSAKITTSGFAIYEVHVLAGYNTGFALLQVYVNGGGNVFYNEISHGSSLTITTGTHQLMISGNNIRFVVVPLLDTSWSRISITVE